MKRDISLYVKDILDAMEKAEVFIGAMGREDFLLDEKTNFAVVRCLEIIGEATKNIPDSIREKYKDIPWRDMAGMRDKVSHFYFGTDFNKVWLAVKKNFPVLKPRIKQVLSDLSGTVEPGR
ncbi:MAG: DUF86 domain-containing protein [Nitrospiraceae bacterium]|nr:DUF86 domain-containing protein [Nitrospiraceae bacterium]